MKSSDETPLHNKTSIASGQKRQEDLIDQVDQLIDKKLINDQSFARDKTTLANESNDASQALQHSEEKPIFQLPDNDNEPNSDSFVFVNKDVQSTSISEATSATKSDQGQEDDYVELTSILSTRARQLRKASGLC